MVSKTVKKAEKIAKTPAQIRKPFKQKAGLPETKVLRNAFPNASHARASKRKSLEKKARQQKRKEKTT